MINSVDVQPCRWTKLEVLSDCGGFAYCYGFYHQDDGSESLALGGRWNGDPAEPSNIGFPSQGGHPTWFVLDDSMIGPILAELEKRAFSSGDFASASRIVEARKAFKV